MTWKARLVCVGRLKEGFAQDGFAHYAKRMAPHVRLDEAQVKDGRGEGADRVRAEGEALLAAVAPKDFVVLLDERGKARTSRQLAKDLRTWFEDPGRTPCFVIGGPYGVSDAVRQRADATLGFGPMTWPHELVRVMLMEQIYRAASILKGLPYHHD